TAINRAATARNPSMSRRWRLWADGVTGEESTSETGRWAGADTERLQARAGENVDAPSGRRCAHRPQEVVGVPEGPAASVLGRGTTTPEAGAPLLPTRDSISVVA